MAPLKEIEELRIAVDQYARIEDGKKYKSAKDEAKVKMAAARSTLESKIRRDPIVIGYADHLVNQGIFPNFLVSKKIPDVSLDIANSTFEFTAKMYVQWCTENWPYFNERVERDLSDAKIGSHPISCTVRAAVEAIAAGNFPIVPSLLFPEVEFYARNVLFRYAKIPSPERRGANELYEIADQFLIALAALIGPRDLLQSKWYLVQAETIRRFVRASTRDVPELGRDHFPNRHAVVHGIWRYPSKLAAINMVWIALVLLKAMSYALKGHKFRKCYEEAVRNGSDPSVGGIAF